MAASDDIANQIDDIVSGNAVPDQPAPADSISSGDIGPFNKPELGTDPPSSNQSTPQDCIDKSENATPDCNMLATAETRSGKYTAKNPVTSASGRYQFIKSTGVAEIMKVRGISSKAEAEALWDRCAASADPDCKKLQDDMCASYTQYLARSLKNAGLPATNANKYLAWNQGAGGARAITESAKTGLPVTNTTILKNMKGQAWSFSSDGAVYIANMEKYLQDKGIPLT